MSKKISLINEYLNETKKIHHLIDQDQFSLAIETIEKTINEGKNFFTMGNGGSAHTASHYITDWNKIINVALNIPVRGICLSDNTGIITAYANDVNYNHIFEGQLRSLLNEGDLVIGISGSGNSMNVINAIKYANLNKANTLAIVGFDGGKLIKEAKQSLLVPSFDMQICEDMHLLFGHVVMKSISNLSIT